MLAYTKRTPLRVVRTYGIHQRYLWTLKPSYQYWYSPFTWSRWSHVGALTGNGREVIESVGGIGVTETPLPEFKRRYKEWRICRIPVVDRRNAYHMLRSEFGKPYDMSAIYGMVFRRNWEESDSWFCSELVAHATGLFRKDYIKRITPEDLWRISED